MRNVESYKPNKKVASYKTRGFSILKAKKNTNFNIKNDPKVIIRSILYSITSLILIGLIIFSAYRLIHWKVESDLTNEIIVALKESNQVKNIASNESDSTNTNPNINYNDPYWDYLKQDLISVDLNNLKTINADVARWIQIPGTNIDYPFVQAPDNDPYLNHSIDKLWNEAGWVFLDYRNSKNLENKNQIIYAHGRIDGSMFGSLQNVLNDEWKTHVENHVVKISTEDANSLWQVFSVYRIPKNQ